MHHRIYNFSAGPATLPVDVLEEAAHNLLSLGETGIGILEHSHRGKAFVEIAEQTEADCRKLANISDDYAVLFLQGGASTQFCMIPMNLLPEGKTADYLVTGSWSKKALKEAKILGDAHVACSSEDRNFCYIPNERSYSESPAYVHMTSNNTIFGTQFSEEPEVPEGVPLVCDASSDIFSRPIDINKYGILYAGAQKNLGPSGLALVIIRKDLIERGPETLPSMLQYRIHEKAGSMYNTPPTFGIYMMGLVFKWILKQGGLEGIGRHNEKKVAPLYHFLDNSSLFKATADAQSRSQMNVTFVTGDADLDAKFIEEAKAEGFDGLKGHRSVGGMRASIYNAFPAEGVNDLVRFMQNFEAQNG